MGMRIGRSARLAKAHGRDMSNVPCARCGRATGRMLLVLTVFVFVAGLAWLWLEARERPGRDPAPGFSAEPLRPSQGRPAEDLLPAEALPSPPPAAPEESELEPFRAARSEAQRYAGKTGSVRGHVEVEGEQSFPSVWRLVARPSLTLPAREHAVERKLEFSDGRQDFELSELPLGGYDLFGEAEGFNGQVLAVLLEPGSEHPFVNLRLVPAGTLEGHVLDASGAPAEGVTITLLALADNVARQAHSDVNGLYRFEQLPDGAYDLMVGAHTSPLMPERRPVSFLAPRLTFPDIELPPLGEIHVRVSDALERPVEGVVVRGSGTNGGLVEGRTDALGRLIVRHLPAGTFRLRISHPEYETYSRRFAVELKVGEVAQAPVLFAP